MIQSLTLHGASLEREMVNGREVGPRFVVLRLFTPKGLPREIRLTNREALALAKQLVGSVQVLLETSESSETRAAL
jgi:hypothetical protein